MDDPLGAGQKPALPSEVGKVYVVTGDASNRSLQVFEGMLGDSSGHFGTDAAGPRALVNDNRSSGLAEVFQP